MPKVNPATASRPLTRAELADLPLAIDATTAARMLGYSYTKTIQLIKAGEFPTRVIRHGHKWRIPTAELLKYLGIKEEHAS